MHLGSIRLFNFRNHRDIQLRFSDAVNCIVGENGSGKTNLLDAVYMLAFTKSAFQKNDQLSISQGENLMVVEGAFFFADQPKTITISLGEGQKKSVFEDKQLYERVSDHIGKIPLVMIAPDDTDVIRDASDTRRRLFDSIMAQFDAEYLAFYQEYNRYLEQRNSLLKQFAERNYFDKILLDSFTEPLGKLALSIARKREWFMESFGPMVQKQYAEISNGGEMVSVVYETEVGADFEDRLQANQKRDMAAQRTTAGIHKDEFRFEFDGQAIKKFGSQGQKKSFVLALKLAQFQLLEHEKGIKPILLLDDIFDKLDDNRIGKLVDKISNGDFGQIFITDARPERTRKIMEAVRADINYYKLER